MRKFTKPLLIVLAMILVCVTSVFATIAYLTSDTEVVSNTFTVGNVEIDIRESNINEDPTDPDDDYIYGGESQTYEDIVPNQTYAKDPTVIVKAGSEPSYVRMFVTITKSAAFDEVFADNNLNLADLFEYNATNWEYKNNVEDTAADTRTYEFWYKDVTVEGAEYALPALFTQVKVPGVLSNAELATLSGFQINIRAEAIQEAGFDNADAAFAALTAEVNA